jgi:hypothetical protein
MKNKTDGTPDNRTGYHPEIGERMKNIWAARKAENTPCPDTNSPEIVEPGANTEPEFQQINGTTYKTSTPARVIEILEHNRIARRSRLVLHYGDGKTGRAWGDTETGYIGRSTGSIKIPLIVYNSRSIGGGGILDHCIVKIETAQGKHLLYQHPSFFGPS